MSTTAELQERPLKRGEKVVNVVDLPAVPEGTIGKVAMANGIIWKRYWVRFDNGELVSHVDHKKLIRARDYLPFVNARFNELTAKKDAGSVSSDGGDAVEAVEAGGAGVVVNGITVPAKLIERTQRARERLGI